jgi:hypothetical protein
MGYRKLLRTLLQTPLKGKVNSRVSKAAVALQKTKKNNTRKDKKNSPYESHTLRQNQ